MHARILDDLRGLLGESHVLTDTGSLQAYGRDWTRSHEPKPAAVLLPGSTDEVAAVVKYCASHNLAMVPSGGRTGLAGGAVAAQGEVVISLNRMNRLEPVDPIGMTLRCEAGVTLQAAQEAAADAGLFFAVDLAAKGSCHVGGNIATNAGGVKFIRYGGMREHVLGLEVVLASGEILDLNTTLRKNNTGYDLKQMFIGSEGTLGIVTKATLRLMPKPRNLQVALMTTGAFANVPQILRLCHDQGSNVAAFEFFTREAHAIVLRHSPKARAPFTEMAPFYVLLEVEEAAPGVKVLEPLLERIFEAGLIDDAVVASSSSQAKELWALRENISESVASHGQVRKNDISLGVEQLSDFLAELEKELARAARDIEVVVFGHIGDGNLHINYVAPREMPAAEFQAKAHAVEKQIFQLLKTFKGSISAEHGIGLLKKSDLPYSRTSAELTLMRQLKKVFDPRGLMNPGKIFDL